MKNSAPRPLAKILSFLRGGHAGRRLASRPPRYAHGGRTVSYETYLEIPTFIRRKKSISFAEPLEQ